MNEHGNLYDFHSYADIMSNRHLKGGGGGSSVLSEMENLVFRLLYIVVLLRVKAILVCIIYMSRFSVIGKLKLNLLFPFFFFSLG